VLVLAARALSHLMEALPAAGVNIVRAGGVPTLCAKLLVFEYIDLAEQCLLVCRSLSSLAFSIYVF